MSNTDPPHTALEESGGERLVGMSELCKRLNIKSRSTIYAHVASGTINAPKRIGRRIGWPSSYVNELIRRR